MARWSAAISLLACSCFLFSCAMQAPPLSRRLQATALVDELSAQAVASQFPEEFHNIVETFEHGEAVLHVNNDDQEADAYYLLALEKGYLLKSELQRRKQQADEAARKEAKERAAHADEDRLAREAARAEQHLQEQSRVNAAAQAAAAAKAKAASREASAQLPVTYTVRRGETLPQIAARTEIYNDASLWPLIYRANRDQIRDPKQLWPGQVLAIPRHTPLKK